MAKKEKCRRCGIETKDIEAVVLNELSHDVVTFAGVKDLCPKCARAAKIENNNNLFGALMSRC